MKDIHTPSNLKFVDAVWFDALGIVKCRDRETNEIKIFVGKGLGEDEWLDIEFIICWGSKYSADEFTKLVEWLVK